MFEEEREKEYRFFVVLWDEWIFLYDDNENVALADQIYAKPMCKHGLEIFESDALRDQDASECYVDCIYLHREHLSELPKEHIVDVPQGEDPYVAWTVAEGIIYDSLGEYFTEIED